MAQEISFKGSRRLVWFGTIVVGALNFAALYLLRNEAMPILTLSCTGILGLIGGWSHVVNKAEIDHAKILNGNGNAGGA